MSNGEDMDRVISYQTWWPGASGADEVCTIIPQCGDDSEEEQLSYS